MAILTGLAYLVAIAIEGSTKPFKKRFYCALFVASLIGLLFVFKFNIELSKIAVFRNSSSTSSFLVSLITPIGISYYLFKLISYVLDVYWENMPAQRNLTWVALYTSFFPQIVSGPIQRADDFFLQLDANKKRSFELSSIEYGIGLILLGILEKTVFADRIGVFVSKVDSLDSSWLGLLLSSYGYAFQLFTDFAGITHVALGLGFLFQIAGPDNFDRPFSATNIQDFWRRWHMSLTTWLTDYVFLPLRMTLRNWGNFGLWLSIIINLFLIGIWHGSGWNFAAFGLIHGLFMIGSVSTLKRRSNFFKKYPQWTKARTLFGQVVTFHMVCFALIFFRHSSMDSALNTIVGILTLKNGTSALNGIETNLLVSTILSTLFAGYLSIGFGLPKPESLIKKFGGNRWLLYTVASIIIALLGLDSGAQFIYAKF